MQKAVLGSLEDNFDLAVHLSRAPDVPTPPSLTWIGIHCYDYYPPDWEPGDPPERRCSIEINFC